MRPGGGAPDLSASGVTRSMSKKDLIDRKASASSPDKQARKAKRDALNGREFELFLDGTQRLENYEAQQAKFAAYILGRLGLRPGELVHIRESWIDWDDQMIEIPRQQDCTKGRNRDVCGICYQAAEQMVEYHDDVTLDEALAVQWAAKTDTAERRVYFGWNPRAQLVLERFFDRYSEWPVSHMTLSRRVSDATDLAPGFEPERMYPHALRATAASFQASRGLGILELKQMMGWSCVSTARHYVAESPINTARELDRIHSG